MRAAHLLAVGRCRWRGDAVSAFTGGGTLSPARRCGQRFYWRWDAVAGAAMRAALLLAVGRCRRRGDAGGADAHTRDVAGARILRQAAWESVSGRD
ncbi:hypothetical protein [Candidatus Sodalis sp. SoCistrobi]|uniref:hypothetical protein n=1 Tax=Candidatus Sodalis sp. SoCistrobi TaxID=1922216 RepID=UPI000938E86E|nr:hypothetical protein [Candidatus Sodalis sp. SoCistrobi]